MASSLDGRLLFDNERYESFAATLTRALARDSWEDVPKPEIPSWGDVAARMCDEFEKRRK